MLSTYLGKIVHFTLHRGPNVSDAVNGFLSLVATAWFGLRGQSVPDITAGAIAALTLWLAVSFLLLRLIASTYFVWKEEYETSRQLRLKLDAPETHQRGMIADQITVARLQLIDQITMLQLKATEGGQDLYAYHKLFSDQPIQRNINLLSHDARFMQLWDGFQTVMVNLVINEPNDRFLELDYWYRAAIEVNDALTPLLNHLKMIEPLEVEKLIASSSRTRLK